MNCVILTTCDILLAEVLLGAADEDGAVCVLQDVVAHTSQQRLAQLAHASRSRHDVVGRSLLRLCNNKLTRLLEMRHEFVVNLKKSSRLYTFLPS